MPTITQYLRSNAQYHEDKESLIVTCMKDLNETRRRVSDALYEIQTGKTPVKFGEPTKTVTTLTPTDTQKTTTQKPIGISELELRRKHDIKHIISQAAKSLTKDIFVPENDFIRQYLQGQSGYREKLSDPDFADYKGRAGGVTYWGNPESIQRMKQECILR